MAFWAVEVKPGKPITHSYEEARGRLRVTQATLGFGGSIEKTILQCNVGNRRPVLLCVLLPDTTDSCRLDFEFEEAGDVVFSVIGPRSVYLAGYYVRRNLHSNTHSDVEPYGADAENNRTDGSSYNSDNDMHEVSFIDNDNEIQVSPESPVLSSKGIDEVTPEEAKLKGRKDHGRQLKTKYQVIEQNNCANSHESEDKDGSLPVFKRVVRTTMSDAGEKIDQGTEEMDDEAKDDGVRGSESKQKVDPLDINGKLERETTPPLNEGKTRVNIEKNELPKEVEVIEKIIVSNQGVIHGDNIKDTSISQNLPLSDGQDQSQSLDLAKPRKKRKERSVKEKKIRKIQTEDKDHSVLREDKDHQVEASNNLGIGENCLVAPPDMGSVNVKKSKKRSIELQLEGLVTERNEKKSQDIPKEDIFEQGLPHSDSKEKDVQAANGEYEDQQMLEETIIERLGTGCHNIPREDEAMQERHADSTTGELPSAIGGNQELQIDKLVETIIERIGKGCHNIPREDETMQERHADSTTEELPAAIGGNQEQQIDKSVETIIEGIGTGCHNIPRKDEAMQERHADSTTEELPAAIGGNQEQHNDMLVLALFAFSRNIRMKSESRANDNQLDKKIKKKMKIQGERDLKMIDNQETMPMEYEDQSAKIVQIQKTTLSNGLITEELTSGPSNGKVAAPGKVVKIYYTAMLKEGGHVFDSNVGKAAFKFRLGDEEFIDGWNVGIDGMHVGDKRRLTIPPSMGFGDHAVENVPPNSWLVYDIELVGVRK